MICMELWRIKDIQVTKWFCFCSAELEKIIEGKNNELANKTEELKERSAQPQRRE